MNNVSTQRSPLHRFFALLTAVVLIATACGSSDLQSTSGPAAAPTAAATDDDGPDWGVTLDEWNETVTGNTDASATESNFDYPEVEWTELVPPGYTGQEIFARYKDRLDALPDGSAEATALYKEMQNEYDGDAINPDLDGQKIRLAGFVAPLTYDNDIVVEFLLVPNFGACIHVPPPPPNQTVVVSVDREHGLTIDETYGPVWVEGTLTIESTTTDLAPASYSIVDGKSSVYER